uniref:Uncharacterized protein n=1 Tax=Arundo donax TaxID=35708 RepID=A0A0A9ALY9_ARUDO
MKIAAGRTTVVMGGGWILTRHPQTMVGVRSKVPRT